MTAHHHEQPDDTPSRLLVVVAVQAEADAVLRGLRGDARPVPVPGGGLWRGEHASGGPVDVLVGGVGPAAVAAATAGVLAYQRYDLVVSAGIAGGFAPRAPIGSVVVADRIVAADLGAETPEGYRDVEQLGFGSVRHLPPPSAVLVAADATGGAVGPVLTVSTVTGTADRAAELTARHPGALAEAMEGFGVAEAAARFGVAVCEIRAVSNTVGPRDRAAWRIGAALGALEQAFLALPYRRLLQEATDG